ncbi:hypothetical protein E2C01_084503 [Portunus trituberculatus]|uniref:Uncharacterized protein n=1 Tax=Portunus trituberculatus TaxID=210409 RepID=A0A5B7IYG0_PORTR|nr:hypothetical protein [Portunus trituberculatus]
MVSWALKNASPATGGNINISPLRTAIKTAFESNSELESIATYSFDLKTASPPNGTNNCRNHSLGE